MSPSGLYNYFTHADNPEKTKYDANDIECGCVFDREKFILENDHEFFLAQALDVIDTMGFVEFGSLVSYARAHDPNLLRLIMNKSYFFARLIDSKRHSKYEKQYKELEKHKLLPRLTKTQKELLSILHISPNTLKTWEMTGLKRLEPPIEGTRTVFYKMEDVLNCLTP